MGYDVHITRADHWLDSKEHPISLDEWKAYIEGDAEMRLDGYAEVSNPQGETIGYENEGLAVWIAWSRHGVGGGMAWMDLDNGEIVAKNPDDVILAKMRAIAAALDANVIGDDGERY